MFRIALLVLMLSGVGPALAAIPTTTSGGNASTTAAERQAGPASERIAQYRSDRGSWRRGVRHHRYFGRGDDWRGHHRGSYDKPHWRERDFRGDRWRHERRRYRPGDRQYEAGRSRYDERHDRRGRWDSGGGSFRGYDGDRHGSPRRFHDRRERFDARRDRW